MGYFAPTFLAFILNSCGVYIFHESAKPGCEPLVSCLIFLFAVFLLLWDIRLFPGSLRKLWRCGTYFTQFFFAAFMMEHIMNDFWFPLEQSLIAFLPKIAQAEEDVLKNAGWPSPGIFQILNNDMAKVIASYMLSLFFLFCVLHATRVIDFRLLSCGIGIFYEDIRYRFKRAVRHLKKVLFRPKVRFQCSPGRTRNSCPADCNAVRYADMDSEYDEDMLLRSRRCRF